MSKKPDKKETPGAKPPEKAPASESKPKKKAPELAVFKPNRPFARNGAMLTAVNGAFEPITLTHDQVMTEIGKGLSKAKDRRKLKRSPMSGVLNHCTLVSGDKKTKEALDKFRA